MVVHGMVSTRLDILHQRLGVGTIKEGALQHVVGPAYVMHGVQRHGQGLLPLQFLWTGAHSTTQPARLPTLITGQRHSGVAPAVAVA